MATTRRVRALLVASGLLVAFLVGTVAPASAYVYFGNGPHVGRATLDGSGVDNKFIETEGFMSGVAVDSAHVYWVDNGTGNVGRASLDGGSIEPEFVPAAEPGTSASGIAVGPSGIYWTRQSPAAIMHAELDGSEAFAVPASLEGKTPCGVAVDSQYVYFGWAAGGGIFGVSRVPVGGGEVTPVTTTATGYCGVAVDPAFVYWTNGSFFFTGGTTIGRAPNTIPPQSGNNSLVTGLVNPRGVAVDSTSIYWADSEAGTIGKAGLDGGAPDPSFVTGLAGPVGVAVDALPLPPPADGGGPSRTVPSLAIGKARFDRKAGTAKLSVTVNGEGRVTLSGKKVKRVSKKATGPVTLRLRVGAKGRSKRSLVRTGRLAVRVSVVFAPPSEAAVKAAKRLVLKKSLPRARS
jgi:hypothetical protein